MTDTSVESKGRWGRALPSQNEAYNIKKTEIVKAAARIFSQYSYHGTTLAEVAVELGVTKQALYYYFPDKQSLLYACSLEAHEGACAILDEAKKKAGTGAFRLAAVLKEYAIHIADGHLQSIMFLEGGALNPDQFADVMRLRDQFDAGIQKMIEIGMADGSLRNGDPKMVRFAALGAVNWIARWFNPAGALAADQAAEAIVQTLMTGLATAA